MSLKYLEKTNNGTELKVECHHITLKAAVASLGVYVVMVIIILNFYR